MTGVLVVIFLLLVATAIRRDRKDRQIKAKTWRKAKKPSEFKKLKARARR